MTPDHFTDVAAITEPQAIDLSTHALIEASAGTGKTYTIENLVVRLLMEETDIQLENILLVTFTEKATGELKQRIRLKIEQTLDADPPLADAIRDKLHASLDGFDNAAIFTIHGFCHTVLREFPFETGHLFAQELIDDPPLLEKLLREQIRSHWPQRYAGRLDDLLRLSDFAVDPDGFIANLVYLAQRLSGDASRETLIPDPDGLDGDALWDAARASVAALKALVGTPPALSTAYGRLNINKATKQKILRDLVLPVEQALVQVDETGNRPSPVLHLMREMIPRSGLKTMPFDDLMPQKWLKAGENLHECPHLGQIKAHLDELARLTVHLSHVLTLNALERLRGDARAVKERSGWISYQDMLSRVADFLSAPGSEAGIRKIRDRYQVAFVDEFQDTDDLQWRIFRTLFMPTGCRNRLFLIGDPKQAIYGFRGADVFTYLDARQTIVRLAAEKKAHLYRLDVNWRSLPTMVAAFNAIFGQAAWFGGPAGRGPFEIGYPPADSPAAERLPLTTRGDGSRRPAFNVVDLSAADSQVQAKERLARFICREIRFLVDAAGIRLASANGEDRPLNYADIAILVRSQGEFSPLEKELAAAAIPYAYYRQPGLFQCRQAHWLSMLLKAVLNPQHAPAVKLALLTPFFDIPAHALETWPDPPAGHLSQQLLARWHADAAKRRWGRLFQSVMEDSGMIARHCATPGWNRWETNLRQLVDYLEATAWAKNMDGAGLVAHLDHLRLTDSGSGEDADIHQIEDEGQKVQILTMHVSKGLEFPVVFIAGGLTTRPFSGMRIYHAADPEDPSAGIRKVVDLTGRTGLAAAQQEFEDENKRLYYVALTRARTKLYVPYYPDGRRHGWIGPICRFVSSSIADAFGRENAQAPPMGWIGIDDPVPVVDQGRPDEKGERRVVTAWTGDRVLPAQHDFRHRRIALESFSSIGHRISGGHGPAGPAQVFSLTGDWQRDDDEPTAGPDLAAADPGPSDDLPGGTGVGSMFHTIFETIDFRAVMDGPMDILEDDGLRQVVEGAMQRYRIDGEWAPAIGRIVARTLRRPIIVDGAPLCLGELSPSQRRHEIEFYFPLSHPFAPAQDRNGCGLADGPCRELVVRGFIDLVFAWQDRYYIADWKSNRLPQGYHREAMEKEMQAAGYDLQYQLYSLSTLRWLRQRIGDRFDPHRHFGGVFYLFIRGMEEGTDGGVYHVPPDPLLPVEALEQTIRHTIAGIQW